MTSALNTAVIVGWDGFCRNTVAVGRVLVYYCSSGISSTDCQFLYNMVCHM